MRAHPSYCLARESVNRFVPGRAAAGAVVVPLAACLFQKALLVFTFCRKARILYRDRPV